MKTESPWLPVAIVLSAILLAPTGRIGAQPFQSNVKEIIVVCKTHFDIGYTHRVKDLLGYYRTSMIDQAMDIMDKSESLPAEQKFIWTGPGWVMAKVVEDWPGQTPERRKRIDKYFSTGRFVTHSMPFTVESELMEPEDIVRGYQPSSFISRKYGLPLPRDAKMTDVPSQGGILATVLAQGGVKFMHIGCNWPSGYVKFPHVPLFWWEGPDGSRVLTFYSANYGTASGLGWPHEWSEGNPSHGKNLIPPKDWPYEVWPAILVTMDNSGPPSEAAIREIFAEAKEKLPGVKIRMGRMEDFADAIIKSGVELPVVKAEMPDTWIHGCMSDPGGMKIARNIHVLMNAAEVLNTELRIWEIPVKDPAADISKAYEQSLLYSEHTWGGAASVDRYGEAFKALSPDQFKDLEGSWDDKTEYIHTAAGIINPLIESNLRDLAKNVKTKGSSVLVYNPLPWTRSGVAQAGGISFIAKDVPGCGYATFTVDSLDNSTGAAGGDPGLPGIENEFFRITLDSVHGSIISLMDKRTGREWVDAGAPQGLGQYLNERFTFEQTLKYALDYQQGRAMHAFGSPGDWPHPGLHKPGMISEKQVPYRAASPVNGTLTVTRIGIAQTAVISFPANPAAKLAGIGLKVTLYDGQPFVDLEIIIRDKAKDNWPEADWLCLPFNLRSPRFTVGRTLGMMNPEDILPGANRDMYAVGPGVILTDPDGAGIAVCPLDHPLISLDRPGCWKFSADFVPKKPVIYLNLYNNQWNTNYRYWYPGTWSSRVRLWVVSTGASPEKALVTPSLEARLPLIAIPVNNKDGKLPARLTGITTSRKGIRVTAFGTDFNGSNGTLLRLWEEGGETGELIVTLPTGAKFNTATPVDLRGENMGKSLEIKNNKLKFKLKAYSPASFILK